MPEPELALVINPAMEIVGITIGNDMSSRDIEGENPLYLPQAKIYTCRVRSGPAIALGPVTDAWPATRIAMQIVRDGVVAFSGETDTSKIRRRPDELVDYLGRCCLSQRRRAAHRRRHRPARFVHPGRGDEVRIQIDAVGTLANSVVVV